MRPICRKTIWRSSERSGCIPIASDEVGNGVDRHAIVSRDNLIADHLNAIASRYNSIADHDNAIAIHYIGIARTHNSIAKYHNGIAAGRISNSTLPSSMELTLKGAI